jgi:hypothetical protein
MLYIIRSKEQGSIIFSSIQISKGVKEKEKKNVYLSFFFYTIEETLDKHM